MYNFFVLGIIPGTNIQITFQDWLNAVGVLFTLCGIVWLAIHQRRAMGGNTQPLRLPLHAKRLHLRLPL